MKIYVSALLILMSYSGFSQYQAEEFQAALLEAKYGALLVYNGQTNSFSLKFVGKSVEPTDQPNILRVDNILMQAMITPFSQELDFKNLDDETQKKWLLAWKTYEQEWVEEQLKQKLTEKQEFTNVNGKLFIYWIYDMPKSEDPLGVDKQICMATICFDQLLILNAPVEKDKSEKLIKDKLQAVATTLTLYPNLTQDIEKLYNELKK